MNLQPEARRGRRAAALSAACCLGLAIAGPASPTR